MSGREDAIQRRFLAFHEANPQVYLELRTMAREAKAAGKQRIGMAMLFEVLRWNRLLDTRDSTPFKLNDHYTSRYARLLMEREPELAGMFEVRELRPAVPRSLAAA